MIINNTEYIHGADHAGLTAWIRESLVLKNEKSRRLGNHPTGAPGDYCKDEIIRYLADPDSYRHNWLLITDERMRPWPLRNMHRRGGRPEAQAPAPMEAAHSSVVKSVSTPAPVCAPASAEAGYPEVQVGKGSCSELPYVGADGRVWFKNEFDVWEQTKGNRTVFEFCGSPRVTGPERLAIIASLIASVPAAAKLLGAGDEYEPETTNVIAGDVIVCVRDLDGLKVGQRMTAKGKNSYGDQVLYIDVGGVNSFHVSHLVSNQYGKASLRILRRSAPDAGKGVGRG
jgi:hypothetical protein